VPDPQTIARNLEQVRAALEQSARRAGRDPRGVAVMAVTKSFSLAEVQAACSAGLRLFGENRVQEAEAKYGLQAPPDGAGPPTGLPGRPGLPPLSLHLIGHLQRNKARRAVELFDSVQAVDDAELAAELSRRAVAAGRRLPVLIEVNVSAEASKFGVTPQGLPPLAEAVRALPGLELRGLMTVGRLVERAEDARGDFAALRRLRDECERRLGTALPELSMGMSQDFEVAVEEGATWVRVGTAIFGPRR
jgi:uncharacterized pyridoxal phosphate-containing UPF0001 family protein